MDRHLSVVGRSAASFPFGMKSRTWAGVAFEVYTLNSHDFQTIFAAQNAQAAVEKLHIKSPNNSDFSL